MPVSSFLFKQRPALSSDGLLVVRGRYLEAERALIVLGSNHEVTRLICVDIHYNQLRHCGGLQRAFHTFKTKYFALGVRRVLTTVLRNCFRCAVRFPTPYKAPMAPVHKSNLPHCDKNISCNVKGTTAIVILTKTLESHICIQ